MSNEPSGDKVMYRANFSWSTYTVSKHRIKAETEKTVVYYTDYPTRDRRESKDAAGHSWHTTFEEARKRVMGLNEVRIDNTKENLEERNINQIMLINLNEEALK